MAKAIFYLTLGAFVALAAGCGGRSAGYTAGRKECANPASVAVIKPFRSEGDRAAAALLLKMEAEYQRTFLHKRPTYTLRNDEGAEWVDGCVAALKDSRHREYPSLAPR